MGITKELVNAMKGLKECELCEELKKGTFILVLRDDDNKEKGKMRVCEHCYLELK